LKLDEMEKPAWAVGMDYYVRLVELLNLNFFTDQVRWFKLLQAENDNLRAAIE
jgi:hypothetical protein